MPGRSFHLSGSLTIALLLSHTAGAGTVYVSQTSSSPTPPYPTWETAAHRIQEAVDAARDGDTVLVAAGEYALTNQVTIAKGILLRSDAGPSQTFLHGQDGQTRVRCLWVSNSVAVVDGFTMRRGASDESGGGGVYLVGGTVQNCVIDRCYSFRSTVAGGAVVIGGTLSNTIVTRIGFAIQARSAVDCSNGGLITDCQITGNGSPNGGLYTGAVYLTDSELRNSVISSNDAVLAGGVYALSSTIVDCTMTGNWARYDGGGAYLDGCEVDRCTIVGNTGGYTFAREGRGGGVFATNSVIRNSVIAGNSATDGYDPETGENGARPGFGGGVFMQGGSLLNCTVTGNHTYGDAGGIYVESGAVRNSIIYFNSAPTNANWYNVGAGSFDHSCTTPEPGGIGNITLDPQFVSRMNRNYRLASTSPCINAGINEAWMFGAKDLDGNPRVRNGTVDLGAWESPYSAPPRRPSPPIVLLESLSDPGPIIPNERRGYGIAVAVSGTRAVVGQNPGGQTSGSVYVYDFANPNPAPLGPGDPRPIWLNNPNPSYSGGFGQSVAMSGLLVVVGAPFHAAGSQQGIVYVYDLGSTTPSTSMATLTNPSPATSSYFGQSVSISGTRVVVGTPYDDTGADDAGTAYVYDLASSTPTEPVATLHNPTPAANDFFGLSVSIAGTRIVVGAPDGRGIPTRAGVVYVYDLTSATPAAPVAVLNNPSGEPLTDRFGESVAISGARVVVGAPNDNGGVGIAYLFDLGAATPTVPVAVLPNPDPAGSPRSLDPLEDQFGDSVAISSTWVVVGAPYDSATTNGGIAYVYDVLSATPTVPVATLNNPSPGRYDGFGHAVAVDGATIIVGAPFDDTPTGFGTAFDRGAAYVFGPTPTLSIRPVASGFATVSWAPAALRFVLQYADHFAPTNWVYAPSGAENPATISTGNSTRFYRLFRP